MQDFLVVRDLTCGYAVPVLEDLNFQINREHWLE